MSKHLLGELLVNAKVISREQLEEVLATPRPPGKKIGHLLLERGWISEAQLTQTLSLQLGVPWVSLYHIDFSRALLNLVPKEMAEKFCLIPIFVRHVKGQGDTLYVATDDPKNEVSLAEVARAASLPARPMIASPADIRNAIRVYYGGELDVVPSTSPSPTAVAPDPIPLVAREKAPPHKPPAPPSAPAPPPVSGAAPMPAIPPAPPAHAPPPPPPPVQHTAQHAAPARQSAPPPPMGSAPVRHSSAPPPSFPPPPSSARDSEKPARQSRPRMVALTLLDGTTLQLPAREKARSRGDSIPPSIGGIAEGLTARDLVSALRAVSHGADASEILGAQPQWEPIIAALMSVLLKKGVIADWEFIEEYKKI